MNASHNHGHDLEASNGQELVTDTEKLATLTVEMRFLRAAIDELRVELRDLKLGGSLGFEKFSTRVNSIFTVLASLVFVAIGVITWLCLTVIGNNQEIAINSRRITDLEHFRDAHIDDDRRRFNELMRGVQP